jgi:hypothetical protein
MRSIRRAAIADRFRVRVDGVPLARVFELEHQTFRQPVNSCRDDRTFCLTNFLDKVLDHQRGFAVAWLANIKINRH